MSVSLNDAAPPASSVAYRFSGGHSEGGLDARQVTFCERTVGLPRRRATPDTDLPFFLERTNDATRKPPGCLRSLHVQATQSGLKEESARDRQGRHEAQWRGMDHYSAPIHGVLFPHRIRPPRRRIGVNTVHLPGGIDAGVSGHHRPVAGSHVSRLPASPGHGSAGQQRSIDRRDRTRRRVWQRARVLPILSKIRRRLAHGVSAHVSTTAG
jgi:hypothetical protein